MTVAASVGAKVFSVACTFVQVPLALHYLGTEAYGLWVTLFGIVLVLNFVDFGLGVGIQHAMARSYGAEDMESMRRIFWTGVFVLGLLGLVVVAVGLPVVYLGSWSDILHIRDPGLRSMTAPALAVAIAAFVIGLPFNAVSRLSAAVQRGWINAGWVAAGSALSLILVALAAYGRWGFLWFLAASLLVPTLQGIGLFFHLLRALGWKFRPTSLVPASEIRVLLRSSVFFAMPQFAMAVVQSAPALAISMAAGSSAVTAYNLLIRLFGPFQQGQIILLTPVWPAYTEAHARNDHGWIVRTLWLTVAAFCVFSLGLAAVAFLAHPILSVWVGPSSGIVTPRLVALTATWCVVQMAAQPSIYYLTGIGRLRQLALSSTPGLLVSAAALFWGAYGGSVNGVLEAGTVGLVLALLPPLAWQTVRAIRQGEREEIRA